MKKNLLIIPFLLMFLVGCVAKTYYETPTESTDSLQEFTNTFDLITETAIPDNTEEETNIVRETPEPVTLWTVTQQTGTVESTFTEEELNEKIQWLKNFFEGVEGCDFPCMGNHTFVVGDTLYEDVVENISIVFEDLPRRVKLGNGDFLYVYTVDIKDSPYPPGFTLVRKEDQVHLARFTIFSSVEEFLIHYGPPDEIWGVAQKITFEAGRSQYEIELIYKDKGLIVSFIGYSNRGRYMDICENQLDQGLLIITVIDPTSLVKYDFPTIKKQYIPNLFLMEGDVLFEEISNIDSETFYKMFSVSDTTNCFSIMDLDYLLNPGDYPYKPSPTPIVLD